MVSWVIRYGLSKDGLSSENRSTVGSCVGLDTIRTVETDREIGLIVYSVLENSIERKGFLEVYMTAEDTP
jgi:hypothetical protein